MRNILVGVVSYLLFSCSNGEYNIKDYGAVGDGTTVNTKFIQAAIDDCSENGGGKVIVPEGIFCTGTILIKNGVNLHLADGARLLGSDNPNDYVNIDPFTDAVNQERGKCLVGIRKVSSVSITGSGSIDGSGKCFKNDYLKTVATKYGLDRKLGVYFSNRPFLVRLVDSRDIQISGVKMENAAAWSCHIFRCNNVSIDGISINSHVNKNADGIDIDSSSKVYISNCDIDTGDDAICLKTTAPEPCFDINVENCRLKTDWGAIKIGTESMGDVYNVNIKNCFLHNVRGGGIKILSADGANVHDINISDIEMDYVDMPIFIRLCKRLRSYRNVSKEDVGSIRDISISNVKATTRACNDSRVNPPSGILMLGLEEKKIENVSLNNINITLPGGGLKEHSDISIPTDETRYPEFSFFGIMPAYGITARYVDGLKLNGVDFRLTGSDERQKTKFIEVN